MILFGRHATKAMLAHQANSIKEIWIQQGHDDQCQDFIAFSQQHQCPLKYLDKAAMDKQCDGLHQGIAIRCTPPITDEQTLLFQLDTMPDDACILVLDSIKDPHNLGAILRSANAFGVTAVVAPKDQSAPLTPTAHKIASGAAAVTPFVQVTNLARFLKAAQDVGFWVTGLDMTDAQPIHTLDFRGKSIIAMGSEEKGLRQLTRKHCDFMGMIPMTGIIDSLNVSVATGIVLAEQYRQKH